MISLFEKVRFDNVYELLKLINSSELYSHATSTYSTYHTDKGQTEKFITELNLIYDVGDSKKIADSMINANGELLGKDDIKTLLIEILMSNDCEYAKCVVDYIELFENKNGKYVYTPNRVNRLKQSGLRNFLFELDLVDLQQNNNTYQLNYDKTLLSIEYVNSSVLSPKTLCILQQIKKDIGDKAELCVMDYERKRLRDNSNLLDKLKHVALTDVNAGYDILSWEIVPNAPKCKPRYIEVKAVPLGNMRFYWSGHEIEVAKKLGDHYSLYLVPRIKEQFLIDRLRIIRNPSIEKFERDGWSYKVENYSIWEQ